jgi:hypothetical protein
MQDERFHVWAVALALPLSTIGVGLGIRVHRNWGVLMLALAGLAALASGALWAEGRQLLEALLSVGGALTLAGAHLLNWRLRRAMLPSTVHGGAHD